MPDAVDRLRTALASRYKIEREIGSGGMAVVYLAADLKHDRRVAIKVLKPELVPVLGAERFLREIRIAAQLAHPNVLPLHDSGEAQGLLYYVMPYVEGETLRDRLRREKQLPVEEALRIAREVADALGFAHSLGLIHRDIKPENILFQAGHAVVSDFGIARAITQAGGDQLTESGLAVGTLAYMSPEQARGAKDLDGRTDIYSLGCVLYEMLSGQSPLDVGSAFPSLRAARATVSTALGHVIAKALAPVPADRFATAAQFSEVLEQARTGRGMAVVGGRLGSRARGLAVAAVLVVAGAGWLATRKLIRGDGTRIQSLVVLPFQNLSGAADQAYFVAGVHDALIGQLARFGALRVVSRTSALQYQDSRKSLPEIARELNVDGVVEGAVFRSGDSVRIRLELLRARPEERQLWAQQYDRSLGNVLAVYGEVAQAIAEEIKIALSPDETRSLTSRQVNPQAYEAYLKGQFYWYKLTPPDLETALNYFRLALEKDPGYALAHCGVAMVWVGRQQMGLASPREAAPKAKAAALKALELDSTLAEAHYVLALIKTSNDWDWQGAEAAFQRAIALKPGFPDAHAFYSHLLNFLRRRGEARAQIDRALQMDPFNPLFLALDGVDFYFERRPDESIAQSLKALKTAPELPVALNPLWLAYEQKKQYREAATYAVKYLASVGQGAAGRSLEAGYSTGGYQEAMRRGADALITRSRTAFVTPTDVAMLLGSAGDTDRVFEWLEKAYQGRDPNLPYLDMGNLERLRGDPRFLDLLHRMKLPS